MKEYNNTDQKLHWLSQVIAKVNRTFVPEKSDDSHTNLYFDPVSESLVGRWINSPNGLILLSLNLKSMQFEWLNKKLIILDATSALDKTMDQIEKDVAAYPAKLGMNAGGVFDPLHFQIPEYGIKSVASQNFTKEGLAYWTSYRRLANEACQAVLGHMQAESEIRIWPHHFDTGIYAEHTAELGIGFGLAMKDDIADNAYFYIVGYSSSGDIEYSNLPDLNTGRWHIHEDWKGALINLSEIQNSARSDVQNLIYHFIRDTVGWYMDIGTS